MSYKSTVKFEVDLDYLIQKSFSSEKLRDAAREVFSDYNARQELGFKFIDEIVKRTQEDNVDKTGKSLKAYSNSYKKSAAFDIYGKSNEVNLTLTGEMLASMTSKSSRDTIKIVFVSESQAAKAHGHINGTRNKISGKKQLPRRDFFGLPIDVRTKLLKYTMKDYNEKRLAEFA